MADPYDDETDGDADTAVVPAAAPVNLAQAQGFLAAHRKSAESAGVDFESIMKQRAAAVQEARGLLDQTIQQMREGRKGGMDPTLMAMAAGFLKTTPGVKSSLAGEIGNAFAAGAPAAANQRMADTDFQRGVAELQMKSASLGDLPLKEAQTAASRKQIAAENAASRVEAQMIRAEGADGKKGSDAVIMREYNAMKLVDPRVAAMSPTEYMEWKSRLGSDRNTPALVRTRDAVNADRAKAGLPPVSIEEWKKIEASAGAQGKEEGEARGQTVVSLPTAKLAADTMAATINRLYNHPGLPKAVGLGSMFPSIPGQDAADFEAILKQVQGQAFLAQVPQMRGLGALTEAEGKKITDSLLSLDIKQRPAQFKEGLKTALDLLQKGQEVLKQKAGVADKPPMEGARRGTRPDGSEGWFVERDGKIFEVK